MNGARKARKRDWSVQERECAYELSQQPKYQWHKPNLTMIAEELARKFPETPRTPQEIASQLWEYRKRLGQRADE